MIDNELTLGGKVKELDTQVAELKGQTAQMNQSIAHGSRLTIWQFISFTAVMAGTLFGALVWISTSLREENRQTRELIQRQIEQTDRRMNNRFEQMENRFEQMENRFDDLRQVVLSQPKPAPPRR